MSGLVAEAYSFRSGATEMLSPNLTWKPECVQLPIFDLAYLPCCR